MSYYPQTLPVRALALLAVLVVLLASCEVSNSPRLAAQGYLGALARLDFAGASRFVAEEGRSNFQTLGDVYADLDPAEQTKFRVSDWTVTGETVTGETATVDFSFDGVKKGQLSLRRIEGVWKVDHRRTF